MRIVVLTKPVPDPATEVRLCPDGRVDRSSAPGVVNGNDEYAVEAALRLVEASPGGGEIVVLAMAPENAPEALRKALAMGADRAVLVTDPQLAGSCALGTTRVLAAALRTQTFDLVLAGVDTSDGGAGVVPSGIATLLGLPYVSYAASIEMTADRVRVRRITTAGFETVEAPLPALVVATQALGEPRYPSLKGIMRARSKPVETITLADLELGGAAADAVAATSRLQAARTPPPRPSARVVRGAPEEAAREIVAYLAERSVI